MAWSHTSTAFAINTGDSVQIFLSQGVEFCVDSEVIHPSIHPFFQICFHSPLALQFAVIQVSAQLLNLVRIADPVETQELQLHSNIRGFHVTGNHLLLWDDTKVRNAKIAKLSLRLSQIQLDQLHSPKDSPLQISHVAAFDVQNVQQAAYQNQHVYTIVGEQLLVHTLQVIGHK